MSLLAIAVLLLASCATPRPVGKTEAEVLYQEAKELVKDSRFLLATEKLNSLRSQYPYSFYSTHAELLQADILFNQENFVESAAAYILFKDFHPKYKKLDYVIWRIADSFFNQIPSTFDRDLAPAFQAIQYYKEITNFYPNSEYGKDGASKIKKCNKMIEDKELYIADFYYKTKVYDSARYRYLSIVNKFKHIKSLREHSMNRVVWSSFKLGQLDKCRSYYGQFEKYVSGKNKTSMKLAFKNCQ